MELTQRKYTWEYILKVILTINQSTLIDNKIRSNIALSLLRKDLQYLAMSFANSDIPSTSVTSTDKYASWHQSVRRGGSRSKKLLGLKKKYLSSPNSIVVTVGTKKINNQISIGSDNSKQRLNRPDILLQENDKLNFLSTLLSSNELIGTSTFRSVVVPEIRFPYKKTTITVDVLLQMDLAKHLLQKFNKIEEPANNHANDHAYDHVNDHVNDHANDHTNDHTNDHAMDPVKDHANVHANDHANDPAKDQVIIPNSA